MAAEANGMRRAPAHRVDHDETAAIPRAPRTGEPLTLGLIARGTLVVLLLFGLASVIWLARDVLFIAFFAVLAASFLSLVVDPLEKRLGLRRAIAAPLALATIIALFAILVAFTWPILQEQFGTVRTQLPAAMERAQDWTSEHVSSLTGSLGPAGDDVQERMRARATEEFADLIGGTIPLLNTVLGAMTGLVLVVFAGLFMAIDPRTYGFGLLRLVPATRRLTAMRVLEDIGETLRRWMAAQAAAMVLVAVLTAIGLAIIGVPAWLALGVIAGILEFVPYVGPALSFIPAIAVALAVSGNKALWVIGLYAVIQFVESNFIVPLLVKGAVKLPPALTLLFQAMMATLFGFLGLLLAVPILAAGKVVVKELYVDEVADEN